MKRMKPEIIVNLNCIIGEGPVYDIGKNILYWIDLIGNKIHAYNLTDQCVTSMSLDQNVGSIAVRKQGGLVAALQNGFYFVDVLHETIIKIGDPESDKPKNRFNDGKCDIQGRFWAGTMCKDLDTGYGDYRPEGALYCLSPDLSYQCKLEGVILSNGLGWSPDNKTMYFIDSPRLTVTGYDYDSISGEIDNPRQVVKIPELMGIPDGMCVDEEGMLWVALWGGHAITRWNPSNGQLIDEIDLPALNVSSCSFGGKDLDELYITTARIGTNTIKYPDAGGIFRIKPGVKGLPAYEFKG